MRELLTYLPDLYRTSAARSNSNDTGPFFEHAQNMLPYDPGIREQYVRDEFWSGHKSLWVHEIFDGHLYHNYAGAEKS